VVERLLYYFPSFCGRDIEGTRSRYRHSLKSGHAFGGALKDKNDGNCPQRDRLVCDA